VRSESCCASPPSPPHPRPQACAAPAPSSRGRSRASTRCVALKAALTTAPVLRVWDLLTDASELAVSAILEQPLSRTSGRRWRRVPPPSPSSRRRTLASWRGALIPPASAGAAGGGPRAQEPSAVPPRQALRAAHRQREPAVATSLHQQRHLSHQQARWLSLLAEFQHRVMHTPGRARPNLSDFLTRKCSPDGVGPAQHTRPATPSRTRASNPRLCPGVCHRRYQA
jgi:hypothetical protein